MAQNKGTPDWKKMLDYNQIDSQAKQQFLKEHLQEEMDNLAFRISEKMMQVIRNIFRGAADHENAILQAAVTKRFGSVKAAAEMGIALHVRRDQYSPNPFQRVTTQEFSAYTEDGQHIKLVTINTTCTHDEIATDYISYVGELKL